MHKKEASEKFKFSDIKKLSLIYYIIVANGVFGYGVNLIQIYIINFLLMIFLNF